MSLQPHLLWQFSFRPKASDSRSIAVVLFNQSMPSHSYLYTSWLPQNRTYDHHIILFLVFYNSNNKVNARFNSFVLNNIVNSNFRSTEHSFSKSVELLVRFFQEMLEEDKYYWCAMPKLDEYIRIANKAVHCLFICIYAAFKAYVNRKNGIKNLLFFTHVQIIRC